MKHRFLRLCAVMVASVALVPATNAAAQADKSATVGLRHHTDESWAGHCVRDNLGRVVAGSVQSSFADLQQRLILLRARRRACSRDDSDRDTRCRRVLLPQGRP